MSCWDLCKRSLLMFICSIEGSPALPFDRSLGSSEVLPAIVYADITSPTFRKFHTTLSEAAKNGRISYRVRHKPSQAPEQPLEINGFGVELALKRTDYIVIDDRQSEDGKEKGEEAVKSTLGELDDSEEVADLKPLSSTELQELDMKTASYVLGTENPLESLLKITQDFPKHTSFLASQNVTEAFEKEHQANRNAFLPSGYNVMWINGVQYDVRKMDPFSILDTLRRERKLIDNFQEMGFTSAEAIQLLSHPAIAEVQGDLDTQRYDWRDQTEGGNVIMWMNDLEKDKRYAEWQKGLYAVCALRNPIKLS
jgi:UDP-glucose:glycoprotein glucosyltransferase